MSWLSRELKHLLAVFGPNSCFAEFRILRFPLITVGNRMVGWLARHGWWCKQASTLEKNKHGEPQGQTLIVHKQGLLNRENEE
jgi:hypothetical protein